MRYIRDAHVGRSRDVAVRAGRRKRHDLLPPQLLDLVVPALLVLVEGVGVVDGAVGQGGRAGLETYRHVLGGSSNVVGRGQLRVLGGGEEVLDVGVSSGVIDD